MSATSLVRRALETKYEEQESVFDDLSVDISAMGLQPGEDVMADFGGFLEKRKKDKNMERNTMMSHIDGLVNNLDNDIAKMMTAKETNRRQKEVLEKKRKQKLEQEMRLREEAERKENLLKENLTEFYDEDDESVVDDSILQKRPSNTRSSVRKSNIFLKERPSNGGGPDNFIERKSHLNKENANFAQSYAGKRSRDQIDEASQILKRKMQQMEADESVRGTVNMKSANGI